MTLRILDDFTLPTLMIRKCAPLLVAVAFTAAVSARLFAIEVQDAKVTAFPGDEDGIRRDYPLTTNNKPDDRFTFTATRRRWSNKTTDLTWTLEVSPQDMEHWAPGISFGEYVATIYRCVDRFLTDVPEAKVDVIRLYITDDNPVWSDIKKRLIAMMKEERGVAVGYPEEKTEWMSALSASSSPAMAKIRRELAKRLKRQFSRAWPTSDGPMLERVSLKITPERGRPSCSSHISGSK